MPDEQLIPAGRRDAPEPDTSPPAAAANGRGEISALADELLPALIARLSASSLGELEVREGSWRVRLRRAPPMVDLAEDDAPVGRGRSQRSGHAAGLADGTDGTIVSGAAAGGRAQAGATQRDTSRLIATSPAVGYFAPRDGAGVGQTVRSGDVLGHIDVLGVRQEVVSPADGIVTRLLAEAGEAVEYGQELVRIDRVVKGARQGEPTDGASSHIDIATAIQAETTPAPTTTPAAAAQTAAAQTAAAHTTAAHTTAASTVDVPTAVADDPAALVAATPAAPDVATR